MSKEQETADMEGIIAGLCDVAAGRVKPLSQIDEEIAARNGDTPPEWSQWSHWYRLLWKEKLFPQRKADHE